MIEVSGDISLGEVRKASIWAGQRLFGRGWISVPLILLYLMFIPTVVMAVDNWEAGGWSCIALAIAIVLFVVWNHFAAPRLTRHLWVKLGARPSGAIQYRIDDEGVHIASSGGASQVSWPAVLQLVQGGPYWLLMASEVAYYVPRRFFADTAAEKAFVAACLDHLSPEARARSGKAVAFTVEEVKRSL